MRSKTVQIIIKAPNQMTDDQSVECYRMWTIRQLKKKLYSVYPTHPKPESQKLIYSGKLLRDDMILTDVLKTYGGHEYNTIHLVSTSRENPIITGIISSSLPAPSPILNNSNSVNQTIPSTVDSSHSNISDSGNNLTRREVNNCPWYGHTPANRIQYIYPQQNLMQQMVFIQQAYMQYMANYIHMANNGGYSLDTQYNELPQNEPPIREVPQNPVEPEAEEDAGAQRDWLEWIYILTRLIVLFSVVYFYSSPLRFIVVMTMALLLFNMDVERWRRRQNEAPEEVQIRNTNAESQTPQQAEPHVPEVRNPHPLNIISTFITSFFLSLIPEQRAV